MSRRGPGADRKGRSRGRSERRSALGLAWPLHSLASGAFIGDEVAGVRVNPATALGLPVAFSAINRVSTDSGDLPMFVFRRLDSGGREVDESHDLHRIVHESPDGDLDALDWKRAFVARVLGYGEAMARIVREAGRPVRLVDWMPGEAPTPERRQSDRALYYRGATGEIYLPSEVFHIKYFSMDGVRGLSPVRLCRIAFGLGLSMREFLASFHGNAAIPSGFIRHPGAADPDIERNIRESFEGRHQGPYRAGRIAVLEEGAEWIPAGMSLDDAQFLGLAGFNREEVAAIYNVPPHKVGIYEHAHFNNLDQSNTDYLVGTINPILIKFEREVRLKLMSPDDRRTHVVDHEVSTMLRADQKTLAEVFERIFRVGGMTPDEIRSRFGLNPYGADRGGSHAFVPTNMWSLERASTGEAPPNNPNQGGGSDAGNNLDGSDPAGGSGGSDRAADLSGSGRTQGGGGRFAPGHARGRGDRL